MFFPRLRIVGIAAAVLAIGSLGTLPVQAGQATGTVNVSATINQNCTIATSPVAFGSTYDPVVTNLSNPLNVTGTYVAITCTKGATGVSVALGGSQTGNNCAASTRCLYNTTSQLTYNLYEAGFSGTTWPISSNGTTGAVTQSSSFGATSPYTVYIGGQIPGAQDVTPGTYSDQITAYVNY